MSAEQNKTAVRRFYDEVWNKGNLEVAQEIFADGYIRHDQRPGTPPPGPAGQMAVAGQFRSAFPDVSLVVDFLVAEGDKVVARWTIEATHQGTWAGVAASGNHVRFEGINIFRFSDDKVAEIWNHRDDLGLMQQLGGSVAASFPVHR